jgi:hypothetical protein
LLRRRILARQGLVFPQCVHYDCRALHVGRRQTTQAMLTKRQAGKAGLTDKEEDAVVAFPKTYLDAPILPRAQSMLKRGKVTLEVYSRVLPHMQDRAAMKVEALLMAA